MTATPQPTAAEAAYALSIKGNLTPEETAALTAIVQAAVVEAQEASSGDSSTVDRTLDRRRRLGLWDRPGSGSWKNSAGWN